MAGNEDLVNALSGGGLLSSIAHPTVVNPLAAYGQANQVAAGIWANRRNQADQAAGQAFQQSVNPDGTPNQAALNRNLVAAGPTAALAAQDSAQKGQTLDTSTFVTHMARLTSLSGAAMALVSQYPNGVPPAAFNAEIDTQAAKLGLSPADVAQAKGQVSADPAANTAMIFRNHATNLSAQQQLIAARPGVGPTIDNGQGVVGTQVAPAYSATPGAVTPVGPVTPTGFPSRTDLLHQVDQPITDPKVAQAMGVPVGTVMTLPMVERYRQQNVGAGLVGPAGTQAPTPPPPGAPALPTGYKPRQGAAAPATPTAAGQPAPPAATPAAATPAPDPSAIRPVVTSLPPGANEQLQTDLKARDAAAAAMPDQQKRLIAGQSALEALQLADTGPGTSFVARANAFLKAQGITTEPKGALSDTDYRQLLQKNLLRFAQSAGKSSGTDLGLETQIHSNANAEEMLAGANRHVLIQDMGILKRDIAQTKHMPAPSLNADVVKHIGSFSETTAPEAFMWNTYSQPERDQIEAKYAKDGQSDKLHRSLEMAVRGGAIPDPRKAAPAATPPPAATPTAPRGPQAMVQPNALAAYA